MRNLSQSYQISFFAKVSIWIMEKAKVYWYCGVILYSGVYVIMKYILTLLFSYLLPILASAQPLIEVPVGGKLYDMYMRGLTTSPAVFSDFEGKPLIINVWASYCGPCLAEMGSLEVLHTEYGEQFNLIGISIDDYADRALGFLKKANTSFNHYIDYQLQLETMLGSDSIPLTVLVDKDGVILHKVRGAQEWDSPENIRAILGAFRN